MSRPLIFMFGGQSSRDEAMMDRLHTVAPSIGDTAKQRATLDLRSNHGIQTSVHAVTLGWLELLGAHGLEPTASAGLSLGEYAHLVAIGALDAQASVDLVAKRGQLYDEGPDGVMAAIYPIAWEDLSPLVDEVNQQFGHGAVAPAVFNSPSQIVVAGTKEAVDAVIELAVANHYAAATVIEHRIPMHVERFRPVAARLTNVLEETPWKPTSMAYYPNVVGEPTEATPHTIVELLSRHVYQPVRWQQTIDLLASTYADGVFVEVGPRSVLGDMMRRRWHPGRMIFSIDPWESATPRETVAQTLAEIRDVL